MEHHHSAMFALLFVGLSLVTIIGAGWVCYREIEFERSVRRYADAGNLEILAIQRHGVLGVLDANLVEEGHTALSPREFTVLYQTTFSNSERYIARCVVEDSGLVQCSNERRHYSTEQQ